MQANLGDLLEEINNAHTGKEHDFNSLADVFKNKGVPPDEIYALIDTAWKNLLIKNKYYPVTETQQDEARAPTDIKFILNIPGFEFLNQIHINKAIVKFNESSDKSYEKIIDLTDKLRLSVEKLSTSTEQLSKSSKRLELFTLALIGFTVLLAMIAVIELVKDFIPKYAVAILGFVLLATLTYIMYILTKFGNKMISQK